MFLTLDIGTTAYERGQCLPFVLEGRGEVAAAVGSSTVVASTTVPGGYVAYLLAYGVTVRDPTYDYSGSLSFQLSPMIDNTSGIWTLQRGSVAAPIPTLIQFLPNAQVQFSARRSVASALAQTVDFLGVGFMRPALAEPGRTRSAACTVSNAPGQR